MTKSFNLNPRFVNGLPIDVPANVPGLKRIKELVEAAGISVEAMSTACYRDRMKGYRSKINNTWYSTDAWANEYVISRAERGHPRTTMPAKQPSYYTKIIPKDREPGDVYDNTFLCDLPRRAEEVQAQVDYELEVKLLAKELPAKLVAEGIKIIPRKNRSGEGLKILPQSFKRYPGYYGFSLR